MENKSKMGADDEDVGGKDDWGAPEYKSSSKLMLVVGAAAGLAGWGGFDDGARNENDDDEGADTTGAEDMAVLGPLLLPLTLKF